VESFVFIGLLRGTGHVPLRAMLGGLVRGLAAGAITIGVLAATRLGWRPVSMAPLPALFTGAGIGLLGIAVFLLAMSVLWLVCGRPEGAETRIVGLISQRVRKKVLF